METYYAVYVEIDERNRITNINSSGFLSLEDRNGWIKIDEGTGDRFYHAQGNYFPGPLYDDRGIPRYAYVKDGSPKWRERTKEEMDADYVPPVVKPSADELLNALMEGIESARS